MKKGVSIFGICIVIGLFSSFSFSQNSFENKSTLLPAFHNYSEILFETHIDIGEHFQDFGDMSEIVQVIKDLKSYNTVEVSDYGWLTNDGFTRASYLLNRSKTVKSKLRKKLNNFKTRELACRDRKEFYDRKFYSALEYLGVSSMDSAMQSAIENEWCATQSRVNYNAYRQLYDILIYQEELFSSRYSYRNSKRNTLIKK